MRQSEKMSNELEGFVMASANHLRFDCTMCTIWCDAHMAVSASLSLSISLAFPLSLTPAPEKAWIKLSDWER